MAVDPSSDEELARRLLSHPHPKGPTSVEPFLRRLPEAVTANIALPPDSELLGSALYSRGGRPTYLEAVLDAPGDAQQVVTSYEREVLSRGWSVFQGFGPMHGGFMAGTMGMGRAFRQGGRGPGADDQCDHQGGAAL